MEVSRFFPHFRPRRWCWYVRASSMCPRGWDCTFAHHESELHPDSWWCIVLVLVGPGFRGLASLGPFLLIWRHGGMMTSDKCSPLHEKTMTCTDIVFSQTSALRHHKTAATVTWWAERMHTACGGRSEMRASMAESTWRSTRPHLTSQADMILSGAVLGDLRGFEAMQIGIALGQDGFLCT